MAKRIARHFLRTLWLVTAILVILYAVLIMAGRELLPVVNRYQPEINRYLSDVTGLDFQVQRLSGLWQGFTPSVTLDDISIAGANGESEALFVNTLTAELDTRKALFNLSPVWRNLNAELIRLRLVETENGSWTIAGHPLGGRGGNLYYLNRMFYYSRLLRIDTLQLSVEFYSGVRSEVVAHNIQVDNAEDFHRITANLIFDEADQDSARFIFEGKGDPSDPSDFTGAGYLNLNRLNLTGSISNLLGRLFPKQVAEIGDVQTDLDLEFWFDWQKNTLVNGRGHVRASEIPLSWLLDSSPVKEFSSDITAWFTPGEDWGFQLSRMSGTWQEQAIGPLAFELRQGVGSRWGELDLATNSVNLGLLTKILLGSGLIEGEPRKALSDLSPTGTLRHVLARFNFSSEKPRFSLRANLDDVATNSWRGTPAAKNVDGFIHAGQDSGYVILDVADSFALHYPQVYNDYMVYGATSGKVAWSIDSGQQRVLVSSNLINIDGSEGQGRGVLHLEVPFDKNNDPQMYLMVGLKNSHSRYLDRYLPQKGLNEQLLQWLRSAIGDAEVEEAGFIWRGSLKKHNSAGRSIQVYGKFANAMVDYRPGWPEISQASGTFVVDNVNLDARLTDARMSGVLFEQIDAQVRQKSPGQPVLNVKTGFATQVTEGLDLLLKTPLTTQIGSLENIEARGDAQVELDLRIPLGSDHSAEDYRVTTQIQNGELRLPGTSTWVDHISGSIQYNLDKGLFARQLQGTILGNPVSAELKTKEEGILLAANALLDVATVKTQLQGYESRFEGQTHVTGRLLIPRHNMGDKDVRLSLNSTLTGITVDLPPPFAKGKVEQARLDATLDFSRDATQLHASVEHKGSVALAFDGGRFTRGELRLLAPDASLPQLPGLLISGEMAHFNWDDWQPLVSLSHKAEEPEAILDGYSVLAPRLDLGFGELSLGTFSLGRAQLSGGMESQAWQLNLEAEKASGTISMPLEKNQIPVVDLNRLYLPALEKNSSKDKSEDITAPTFLDQLKPQDIPQFDFSVKELFIGTKPWGSMAFQARSRPLGVNFSQIKGTIRGLEIKSQLLADSEGEGPPAALRWTHDGNQHMTHFSGGLTIADVEDVFNQWQIPAPLRSKSAALYADLAWQGQPWKAELLALDGYLGLEFIDGQFYKTTSPGTNTLFKLISLINFDTWLRRLRFDFSDLFSEGVSFDDLKGGLLFQKGQLTFDEPLVASMPSGKIRLMGGADLANEMINARLVATVPVGTNLPWVAGLLGGLPAAAGVFLTSKLFEKQVDQLSSLSYRIEGTFDEPEVEVEKVFTDPTGEQN